MLLLFCLKTDILDRPVIRVLEYMYDVSLT